MSLVLASTSASRRALLARLGLPFVSVAPQVDETPLPGEDPETLVSRLAQAKALAVASRHAGNLVIGADQVAALGGQILGKPGGYAEAVAQLRLCSGRTARFHTGLCLIDSRHRRHYQHREVTDVRFRALADEEIERYLRAEQPYDAAGSFHAEGLGISLFDAVESRDPTALLGLPLISLCRFLRNCGLAVP